MTPFARLGLYAAGATVAGILAWVTQNVGFYIGLAAMIGGILLTAFATFEMRQPIPEEEPSEEQQDAADQVLVRRNRRDIAVAAERAREADDDDLDEEVPRTG